MLAGVNPVVISCLQVNENPDLIKIITEHFPVIVSLICDDEYAGVSTNKQARPQRVREPEQLDKGRTHRTEHEQAHHRSGNLDFPCPGKELRLIDQRLLISSCTF